MRISILLGLLIFLMACEQKSSAPASGEQVDLRLYDVEEVSNDLQRAVMKDVNGNLVEEGFIRNGVKTGTWVKYHPEGKSIKSMASYIDGQLNGVFLEMDQHNRILSRVGYKNGIYHGPGAKYRTNRPVEEFTYKDGKLDGKFKQYDDRYGTLIKEVDYKDGEIHGRMVQYNRDEEVILEYRYENGKKVE
ncbi:MAG: hypothetical protein AAFP82_02435 [Bacteroidota bacterium]